MKKVFITGGTSGLGLALAEKYRADGWLVGICGRNLSKVPAEVMERENIKAYEADVTDRARMKEVIEEFAEGKLDLIIANAGRSVGKKTTRPNWEASRDVININVMGVLNTFEPAIELMIDQGYGHICAIASVAGMVGLPGAAPYSASKAAVLKLCESYSLDLKKFNIDVTTIAPGFVDTPLTQQNNHPMPFLMPAEKAARLMKDALDKKKVRYLYPWQMRFVMETLSRLPRCLYRKIMSLKRFNYSSSN
jgi:NAD(P)-dependent dehydrogenase (short-subunit alcohol dehydrogenase family)